jgi:hypothetical protein
MEVPGYGASGLEVDLARDLKGAQERAAAAFNKQKDRANEGKLARAAYEAEARAVVEKTARLKTLRLAKEAADRAEAAKIVPVVAVKKKAKKRATAA